MIFKSEPDRHPLVSLRYSQTKQHLMLKTAWSVALKAGQMTTFSAAIPHRFESRVGALAKGVFLVTYQQKMSLSPH